jgi:HAD superfamily hydrolase (TIGR01509 family)
MPPVIAGDFFIPAAVILDMDGLMLDTEAPNLAAWMEIAGQMGWDLSAEAIHKTIGIDAASSRAAMEEIYGTAFPYDKLRRLVSRKIRDKANKDGIGHRPGLITFLNHAAAQGIPLAVATSADREAALWKLERGSIAGRFDAMAFGNEVSRGKPAPDIFLLAAERLGKSPALCAGFEDSPAGLLAILDAGMRPVFIKDLVTPPPEVLAKVWRVFPSLAEAVSLFPEHSA